MGTISFYPAHHITTGEGGAIVTDNSEIYTILRFISDEFIDGIFEKINLYREDNVTSRIGLSEIVEKQLSLLFGHKWMMDGLLSTLKANNKWRKRRYNKFKQK